MNETEAAAIEEGFKRALIQGFMVLYLALSDVESRWNDGAATRFAKTLRDARAARAAALKIIEG